MARADQDLHAAAPAIDEGVVAGPFAGFANLESVADAAADRSSQLSSQLGGDRFDALVVSLDAIADHLQDANDQLGHRASGLSLAAAGRRLAEALPQLADATARTEQGDDDLPTNVRNARARLRDADHVLGDLSRRMLGLVPPDAAELARIDLDLCRWAEAARLLATWVEEAARP